jgi:hypothetical protein
MVQRESMKNSFTFCGNDQFHFASILVPPSAPHETALGQAIYQLDRTVGTNLQSIRKRAYVGSHPYW